MKKDKKLKSEESQKETELQKGSNDKANPNNDKSKKKDKASEKTEEKSQEKPNAIVKQKKVDEIDDIFGSSKKEAKSTDTKKEGSKRGNSELEEKDKPSSKKAKIEGNKDDIFGEEAKKGRKKTEEGYNIYTEDELGLGRAGGNTELCPFDCNCCF
uniref:DUF1764 domain-containing protein n=1 Tax=Polytomella parva TaxID=51329 RepID=A0A7S0UUJ0_9CHLO